MQQAEDFRSECICLANIIEPLTDAELQTVTQFKGWTINDVVGHLHMFNVAARLTLEDAGAFQAFMEPIVAALNAGQSLLAPQENWLNGLQGKALVRAWREECLATANAYANCDPKDRIEWVGPGMSARSSITARQMETWAHGQEVFDCLGLERREEDRLKNIAHLGVSTFGWTFVNRKEKVPSPPPFVELISPSGTCWSWGEPQAENSVKGSAVEFCQVVTQTRNVADTSIKTTGQTAQRWMEIAQCFAGKPETPPAVGTRFMTMVPRSS